MSDMRSKLVQGMPTEAVKLIEELERKVTKLNAENKRLKRDVESLQVMLHCQDERDAPLRAEVEQRERERALCPVNEREPTHPPRSSAASNDCDQDEGA
jgi:septal ring factor EnvC (AmiA/AmiB activator)